MSDINIYADQTAINALSPITGDVVLRESDNAVLLWNGAAWKEFHPDAGPFTNLYSSTFDALADNVLVGDVSTMTSSSAFSISAHFKADNHSGYIFGFRGFYARVEHGGGIFGRMSKFYTWSNSGSGVNYWGTNTWHHIVVVWDAPNVICYIDGTEIINANPGAGNLSGADNGNSMRIGSHYGGAAARFNGKIDEVAIWSKALSPSEVSAISGGPNNLLQTASTNLEHWWRMGDGDDITGSVITDQVGSLDGTAAAAGQFSTDVPS